MDTQTILAVATSMLIALAAVGEVVFKFWRESQRDKKRPRK
jgi:hypothetical protein